jgi:hypothetical protein
MAYVSARYVPETPMPESAGTKEAVARPIEAIDDQGLKWSFREDSQVGDWLEYLNNGGTIDPMTPEELARSKITPPPPRDIYAELDDLNARVTALELAVPYATPGVVYGVVPDATKE